MEDTGEKRMKMSSPEVVAKPEASLSVVEAGGPHDEEPREYNWAGDDESPPRSCRRPCCSPLPAPFHGDTATARTTMGDPGKGTPDPPPARPDLQPRPPACASPPPAEIPRSEPPRTGRKKKVPTAAFLTLRRASGVKLRRR